MMTTNQIKSGGEGRKWLFSCRRWNSKWTPVSCKFNPGIPLSYFILSPSLKRLVGFPFFSSWSSAQAMKATHPAFLCSMEQHLCFIQIVLFLLGDFWVYFCAFHVFWFQGKQIKSNNGFKFNLNLVSCLWIYNLF